MLLEQSFPIRINILMQLLDTGWEWPFRYTVKILLLNKLCLPAEGYFLMFVSYDLYPFPHPAPWKAERALNNHYIRKLLTSKGLTCEQFVKDSCAKLKQKNRLIQEVNEYSYKMY